MITGLFDGHVHGSASSVDTVAWLSRSFSLQFFLATVHPRRTRDCGITMVRDAGGADSGIREAVARGIIGGHGLQISSTALGQTGGHIANWFPCSVTVPAEQLEHPGRPDGLVDGGDHMRRKAREVTRESADAIKVCTSGGVLSPRDKPHHSHISAAELDGLVEGASGLGLRVRAHAQGATGIKASVRAGIRSLARGICLDEESEELMGERATWQVPTLSALLAVVAPAEAGAQLPSPAPENAKEAVQCHRKSFQLAGEAGVRIAMGPDRRVGPKGSHLHELTWMHDYGLAPSAVLTETTSSAAEFTGVQVTRGSTAAGMFADLVFVSGSPFEFRRLPGSLSIVFRRASSVPGDRAKRCGRDFPPAREHRNSREAGIGSRQPPPSAHSWGILAKRWLPVSPKEVLSGC